MRLYVIFDTITEKCSPVFEQVNDVSAMRSSIDMMRSTRNPEDFVLRWCGRISDVGMITSVNPCDICKLSEVEDVYHLKTGKQPLPTEELKKKFEEPPVGDNPDGVSFSRGNEND